MWQRWNGTSKTFEKSADNGVNWTPLGLDASILTQGLLSLPTPGINTIGNASGDSRVAVRSGGVFQFQAVNASGNGFEFGATSANPPDAVFSNNAGIERVRFTDSGHVAIGLSAVTMYAISGNYGILEIKGPSEGGRIVVNYNHTVIGEMYANSNNVFYIGTRTGFPVAFVAGGTEKFRITAQGQVAVGAASAFGGGNLAEGFLVACDHNTNHNISLRNTGNIAGGSFMAMYNYAGSAQGSITCPSISTVSYNTSSDQRLKKDLGIVKTTDVLPRLVIHDFEWLMDRVKARGVFAQEAVEACPAAITVGDDDLTKTGEVNLPWMTDYSKFIPDLIVGWQEHEAKIKALEDKLG